MLEGIDGIDWGALEHAYGSAADVPAMLRRLASSDDDERGRALDAAYSNIFHQGTRYTATPKAIPYLIELAGRPGSEVAVVDLLGLVRHCIAGYFSTAHGPRTASGAIWGTTVRAMEDYGETVAILEACEQAAEPLVPLCVRLLSEQSAGVRAAALHAIAALHVHAERYEMVPRLGELYRTEQAPELRAMIAFALTHVLPVGKEAELVAIARGDADDLVRVVAAMGCIRRGAVTAEMTSDLFRWLEDDELGARYGELSCRADDLAGDLGGLLTALDRAALAPALPSLVDKLRVADDFGVCGVLAAALRAVFGDVPAPADAAVLTAEQREVLETLVGNQAFWAIGNAMSILDSFGVPAWREKLAGYLGVAAVTDPVEQARIGARAFAAFGPQRAAKEWLAVLEKNPDDAEAQCQLGILYAQLGNEDARELLEAGLGQTDGLRPDVAGRAYFALGIVRHQDGDVEEALAAFTRAQPLLRGGEREQARSNRIAILHQMKRMTEALVLAEEKPARTTADFYQLGLAQVKAGKYVESIASMTRLLDEEPDHALAHYTIACAYALDGKPDEALVSVARALESDPDLADDIAADSDLASIADDPRFKELVGEGD